MSFSTTLYRISEDVFRKLESGEMKPNQTVSNAKEFVTFQDSPDAIIFILRNRSANVTFDVSEIFYPQESKGSVSDEEFQKLVEAYNYEEIERICASEFRFLTPDKVIAFNSFLSSFDNSEFKKLYDSDALNSNNIYPSLWTSDEDPKNAFNLNHVYNDFLLLKRFFDIASTEKDYILAFSG